MFLCLLWPFPENVPLPDFAKGSCIYLLNMDIQDNRDETLRYRKRVRSMIGFVFEVFHELGSGFWNPY